MIDPIAEGLQLGGATGPKGEAPLHGAIELDAEPRGTEWAVFSPGPVGVKFFGVLRITGCGEILVRMAGGRRRRFAVRAG